jgi:hypothetical protein
MSEINLTQIKRCENATSQSVQNGGAFEQAESMFKATTKTTRNNGERR